MITLSNGHSFQFMTASGALAFDGRGWPWEWPLRWCRLLNPKLFTIVIKTLTRYPRRGNLRWSHPWSVVKSVGNTGIVNAIGLTNPGIDWWIQKVVPRIPKGYKIVVSVEASEESDVVSMIRLLENQPIQAIELNLSCPNSRDLAHQTLDKTLSICHKAASMSPHPLIAKLAYTHDYLTIAKEVESEKMIQALSINSIPWLIVFPQRPSPLRYLGGGAVSGKLIQDYSWKMLEEMCRSTKVPVIGPSIWEYDDIQKVIDRGAQAVSFGSVFVRHPWRPSAFARKWLKSHSQETSSAKTS